MGGSKPTNCNKKLKIIDLQASSAKNCSKGVVVACNCKDLPWYKRWWNTIKGWFGSKPTNCRKVKAAFYYKYGKVMDEGLALGLYTSDPVSVLKNMPSFTDDAPLNRRVSYYNEFAKAKSALLAYDRLDAQFLNLVENYISTWAITPEQELSKLHEAF